MKTLFSVLAISAFAIACHAQSKDNDIKDLGKAGKFTNVSGHPVNVTIPVALQADLEAYTKKLNDVSISVLENKIVTAAQSATIRTIYLCNGIDPDRVDKAEPVPGEERTFKITFKQDTPTK